MRNILLFIAALIVSSCAQKPGVNGVGKTPLSVSEGIEQLRTQFEDGVGPEESGYAIDYKYYSPVGEDDNSKYPFLLWIHGMGQGFGGPGAQIKGNDIPLWTSLEYQQRVQDTEGMYVFVPRAPEPEGAFWMPLSDTSISVPPASLYAAVTDFVSKNLDHIDTERIYVGGFSMGGYFTWKMLLAYPDYFAAALPTCPAYPPTAEELETIKNVPVWVTSSKQDPVVKYDRFVEPVWAEMTKVMDKSKIRLSSIDLILNPDGSTAPSNHHAWVPVTYDGFMSDNTPYKNTETVDGNNESVTITYPNAYINWLTQWSK